MANIFGFSHMVNKYHITHDSDKEEDAFLIHMLDKIVKFMRTLEGLDAFRPPTCF